MRAQLLAVTLTTGLVFSIAPGLTTVPAVTAAPVVHETDSASGPDLALGGERLDGFRAQGGGRARPGLGSLAAQPSPYGPRQSWNDSAEMVVPKKSGDPWVHIDDIRPDDGPTARSQSVADLYRASGVTRKALTTPNHLIAAGAAGRPPGPSEVPGLAGHVNPSCTGTGTDGNRVQVFYARETGQSDRFASVLPLLQNYVANVDDVFAVSSRQTGGGTRVRWVQTATCEPDIRQIVLPSGSLGSSPTAAFAAVRAAGYDAKNRKYLLFSEGHDLSACGWGESYSDTRPAGNSNDGYADDALISRVDCWNTLVAAHELMHTFGAVQAGGPNATTGGHCTDASDLMCYNDGTGTTTQVCPVSNALLLDCNHDDYFSTNPPAGSYLATHWNTAKSSFLDPAPVLSAPPTVSMASSKSSMVSGESITLTASADRALDYTWTSNSPAPDPSSWGCHFDLPTGPTVHLTCDAFETSGVTVIVTGTDAVNNVTATASITIALSIGPAPTVTVNGPDRAEADATLTYTATPAGIGPFTYQWMLYNDSCAFVGADNQPSVSITCPAEKMDRFVPLVLSLTQRDRQTARWAKNQRIVVTPRLMLKGPKEVEGGTTAEFSVAGGSIHYWGSARGWPVWYTGDDGVLTVSPPRNATGSDTLTVEAYASDGVTVTKSISYQVTPSLSVVVTGPDTIVAGTSAALTATPGRPVPVTWDTSEPDCPVVGKGTTATLSCASSFTGPVDVTATADDPTNGAHAVASHRLNVTAPPADPKASITGPAVLTAGRPGTYQATTDAFPVDDPASAWAWTADRDCIIGSATTTGLTLRCDAAATGAVNLTLTATSRSRIVRSTTFTVTLTKPTAALTVTADAATLTPGDSTTVRAALTGNGGGLRSTLRVEQSSDGTTWTGVGSGTYQAADGTLTLQVTPSQTTTYRVTSGSATKTVTVTLAHVATTSIITAEINGTNVTLAGTLTQTTGGSPVAGATVPVQVKWYGSADWLTLGTITTTATGAMSYPYDMTTRAGTFQFAYAGTTVYAPATTASVFVKVPTKITATVREGRPNTLTATAATASGTGLSKVYLTLQRRTKTGTWAKVSTVRANTKGVAIAKVRPGKRTTYRWVLAASTTHNAAISDTQTVKK